MYVLKVGEILTSKDFGLEGSDLAISIENKRGGVFEIGIAKQTLTLSGTETNFFLKTCIKLLK